MRKASPNAAMPSGLIALLDDVATIAKLAASSLDDVAGAAGKAGTKAAGVVIDDTAVTPRYVIGLAPERELPIIGKIAWGSLRTRLLFLLPAALLLTAFAPFLTTPLLMIGGAYLAFEATEKILEKLLHEHEHEEQLVDAMGDPAELEKMQVKGAIRTDFILSAEIMAIALASLEHLTLRDDRHRAGRRRAGDHRRRLRRRRADREARRHRPAHGPARQPRGPRDRRGAGARSSRSC